MDIPWADAQVATFGESFKAWTEQDFEEVYTAVLDVRPPATKQLVTVVCYFFSDRL